MRPIAAGLLLSLQLALCLPNRLHAAALEPGDIVVPGNRIPDIYTAYGCMYRIRGGEITRLFESNKYVGPRDMVIDAQGRLVFWATPASRNVNDTALFRIDPADGSLERLWYFPYIPAVGDTLPAGASDATQFYGTSYQSMHLEKAFAIEIDDDENGGWPQVSQPENYGFTIGTVLSTGAKSMAYRYLPAAGQCEVGTDLSLLPWNVQAAMAEDAGKIYYGWGNMIVQTAASSRLSLHLDGDWGTLDASLNVPPKPEVLIAPDVNVFDNTEIPNGFVDCGSVSDGNVPFAAGGTQFSGLSISGLGLLNGQIYIRSTSAATGVPYVFNLTMRAPFLNPYWCDWFPVCQGSGPLPWNLPDGTPTSSKWTSTDGSALLGQEAGKVKSITSDGGYTTLASASGDINFSGRPWRWNGPSSKQIGRNDKLEPGAQLLLLRADALVHVLLTDALGQRIGFDAAGNAINDFGASAQTFVGPGGWPKLIALRDPELGIFSVDVHALGAGDWTVKAYLSHQAAGGFASSTAGTALDVESVVRGLYIGNPLGMSWHQSPTDASELDATRVRFAAGPVPARGSVRFGFRLPESGAQVRLDVFDLRGRLVATPLPSAQLTGQQLLQWDARALHGARLARGVYLAKLVIDGEAHVQRVVLLE